MRNYSAAMAGIGLLILVLTVSAALAGANVPAVTPGETTEEAVPVALIELPSDRPFSGQTGHAPVPSSSVRDPSAETLRTESAGPFLVAMRAGENVPDRIFLGDDLGSPLEQVEFNADGEAALGPVPPGIYTVVAGTEELGRFRLPESAVPDEVSGQLWTEGEVLHLESYVPGTVEAEIAFSAPGLYTVRLTGAGGEYRADVFVSERERPAALGCWRRTFRFPGLPAGVYALFLEETRLTGLIVRPGAVCTVSAALAP